MRRCKVCDSFYVRIELLNRELICSRCFDWYVTARKWFKAGRRLGRIGHDSGTLAVR